MQNQGLIMVLVSKISSSPNVPKWLPPHSNLDDQERLLLPKCSFVLVVSIL